MLRSRFAAVAVISATALLAACGSSSPSSQATGDSSVKPVAFELTDSGCDPNNLTLPSGPTTFNVTGDGTAKVTELEILDGTAIKGEVENVVAGISKKFTLNLQPGSYGIHCPGGSNNNDGVLTVSGTATTLATDVVGAVSNYRAYVQGQANDLVVRTQQFTDAVIAGDVVKSKALYAQARAPYESIEPVAESFSDLDTSIDARADDTPVAQITGFHRIENQLYANNNTDGMTPIAQQLLVDVKTLQSRIPTIKLDAAEIANGANDLLDEVSASKITGEEERYSHTDLSDFQANVAGAKAAIDAVRPLLNKVDPDLGTTIDTRYAALANDLSQFKDTDGTNGGYVLYNTLNQDQIKQLSQETTALAEPVSQVAAKVAG